MMGDCGDLLSERPRGTSRLTGLIDLDVTLLNPFVCFCDRWG